MTGIRDSLRIGLLIGLGTSFAVIIGMLQVFAERYVIAEVLTLSTLMLVGIFLAAGLYAVRKLKSSDLPTLGVNGSVAGATVVVIVVAAVLAATGINNFVADLDMSSVFPNVNTELVAVLTLGQVEVEGGALTGAGAEDATDSGGSEAVGYLLLLALGAGVGALGGLSTRLPGRVSGIALNTTAMIVIVGLLQDQINAIITLPDAVWLMLLVSAGYGVARWRGHDHLLRRLGEPLLAGLLVGIATALLLLVLGASAEAMPDILNETTAPILTSFVLGRDVLGMLALFAVVGGALGVVGGVLSSTSGIAHRIAIMILLSLLVLGVINASGEVTVVSAAILAAIIVGGQLVMEQTASEANARFVQFNAGERRTSQTVIGIAGLAFALIIPQLLTGYINNVVDLVGLFTMMGLGLNIVVGYAGLLDLGYVAFFAIGAYSTGLLTTPNVVTCPPPGGNVVVVQQALADEGAFADDFDLLRGEPVGVVSGTRAPYVAVSSLTRPNVVEFDNHDAALAALQSGEVLALVDQQDALNPILDTADGLAISAPFAPAIDAWPAREFNEVEQSQWCNVWSFWAAWPMAVLISGLAGVALGIPVLRLRGDYLAIVTLGFGEIIRLVTLADAFKPFLGGAQGIINIQSPVIDLTNLAPALVDSNLPLVTQLGDALAEPISLSRPNEIYYLILAGVLLTAFISHRLSRSRLGRSWRAMREDEDVAQAMGVNLVRSKLLAFSIGAAFSGIGGAIFGSYLRSIFPNSFTLLVSINVLSLIIIGGMGSIPGVFIGALAIFGLPEALREFEEFRLLMFGGLLVLMMLLRPEGLLPPRSPRLEEDAEKALAEEGSVT